MNENKTVLSWITKRRELSKLEVEEIPISNIHNWIYSDKNIKHQQNYFFSIILNTLFFKQRFEAYMASHNHHLQSTLYVDRNGMPGNDITAYIRRYALYLNEKRESYKLLGYDFCKIKRGFVDELILNN